MALPGFFRRSLDEFRRQATIAIRMEGIHRPTKPFPILSFSAPQTIATCKLMSDQTNFGGLSRASLTYVPGAGRRHDNGRILNDVDDSAEPSHALFAGSISTELPPNRPDVQRSGFAAFRTRDRGVSLFGRLIWDIDPFAYLALRIKSDGRNYFINIQTDSIVPTDIHQHLLPCYTPGEWETVMVPFSAFVRTNYGMVVEPQREMLRQKVKSVGLGLTDRVNGPFGLRVADVYATNRAPEEGREGRAWGSGFEVAGGDEEVRVETGPKEPEKILI